jgi:DNA-binding GntR family transcriptional regulator
VLTSEKVLNQIESVSKKDRVVAALRGAIVSGSMRPGDPIVEIKVGRQLGVGQPLVREALIELEHQGFVRRLPYRGTYVTKLSQQDVEEIFNLRIKLEGIAVDWAKRRVGPEDIETLRRYIRAMKAAAGAQDATKFYENDLALHREIWNLSGNRYLVEALERVVAPLFEFFVMKTTNDQRTFEESAEKHERIVEAFVSSNAGELTTFMEQSLGEWKDDMLISLLPPEDSARV